MRERVEAKGRILFAAAQADGHIEGPEVERILAILERECETLGLGDRVPAEILDALSTFDSRATSLGDLAAPFAGEDPATRRRLLELVVEVHEADGELDYAEDTFVRQLGQALGLEAGAYADLLLEIVDEDEAAPRRTSKGAKKTAASKKKSPAKKSGGGGGAKKKASAKKPVAKKAAAKKKR